MPGRSRGAIGQKDCLPDFRQNNHSRGFYRCRCYTFASTVAMLFAKPCLTRLPVPNSYHFSIRERQGKYHCHHTICPSPYDRRHLLCHRYSCRQKSPVPDTSPAGSCHILSVRDTGAFLFCSAFVFTTTVSAVRNRGNKNIIASNNRIL